MCNHYDDSERLEELVPCVKYTGAVREAKIQEVLNTPATHEFVMRGLIKDLTDTEVFKCLRKESRVTVRDLLHTELRLREKNPKPEAPQKQDMFHMSDAEYERATKGLIFG